MRAFALAAATAAAIAIAPAAHAGSPDGKFQIKVLGTAILPEGDLKKVKFASPAIAAALPANADTKATDAYVPTISAEYFVTPNVSFETICCLTRHGVRGAGGLKGARLVKNIDIIPATLTAKYHFGSGAGVKPYIGAGPTYWFMFNEKPGSTMKALGATKTKIGDKFGLALQAGVDIPVNSTGMSVSLDAKRYFIDRNARWYAGSTKILETDHNLDPWVLSAGLGWRF